MNTIKKTKKRNKNEWMRKKGGAAVLWRVQKIKGEKEGRRAREWAYGFGFGPVPGRVEREYIRVVNPLFPHFFFSFSLFSSFESKRSLLSPKAAPAASSSPARRTAVEGSPTRWPASYRGGATASELKIPFFKIFYFSFPMYFNLLSPFLKLKFRKKVWFVLDLKI